MTKSYRKLAEGESFYTGQTVSFKKNGEVNEVTLVQILPYLFTGGHKLALVTSDKGQALISPARLRVVDDSQDSATQAIGEQLQSEGYEPFVPQSDVQKNDNSALGVIYQATLDMLPGIKSVSWVADGGKEYQD